VSAHVEPHGASAGAHPVEHTFHPYRGGLNPVPLGLIIFLISEIALFGAFFMFYGHNRLLGHDGRGYPWPPPGFEIPANSTSINTAILIASSFTCEFAMFYLMRRNRRLVLVSLVATFLLGAAFLGLQAHEYTSIGFTPQTKAVGASFFSLTGLHGAHVFLGLTLLMFCIIRAARGRITPEHHTGLLVSSIYWHFVDIVWIVLYTLVYLLPDRLHGG
jgi:cytochrome c oxidase subunit 3